MVYLKQESQSFYRMNFYHHNHATPSVYEFKYNNAVVSGMLRSYGLPCMGSGFAVDYFGIEMNAYYW